MHALVLCFFVSRASRNKWLIWNWCIGMRRYWRNLDAATQQSFLKVSVDTLKSLVSDKQGHAQLLHVPADDILWHVMLSNINQDALNDEVMIQTLNPALLEEMMNEEVVVQAIQYLAANESKHACYWRCPSCALRFGSGKQFLNHVSTHHETVQYACEDTPLMCLDCAQEVVGAFYYIGDLDDATHTGGIRCLRCAWEDNPQEPTNVQDGWTLHVPRDIILRDLQGIDQSLGLMSEDSEEEFEEDSSFTSEESGEGSSYTSDYTSNSDSMVSDSDVSGSSYDSDEDYDSEDSFVSIDPPDGHLDGCPVKQTADAPRLAQDGMAGKAVSSPRHVLTCTCTYRKNPLGFSDVGDAQALAIQSRIQNSEDLLLATIVYRIDTLAMEGDVSQFESAITNVVQQTQRMMHGALASLVYPEEGARVIDGGQVAEREEARKRLSDKEKFPNQAAEVREAIDMLNPSELQDLLALMAKKYAVLRNDGTDGDGDADEVRQASKKQRAMGLGDSRLDDHGLPKGGRRPSKPNEAEYDTLCVSVVRYVPQGGTTEAPNPAIGALDAVDSNGSIKAGDAGDAGDPIDAGGVPADVPLPAIADADQLVVHDWWTAHLVRKTVVAADIRSDKVNPVFSNYLLQWIFGNVSHAVTAEFLDRQRIARGNKPIDRAIMDAFAEIAETWRHLAATMDRKRHISTLREAVAEDMKAVSEFGEDKVETLRTLSDEFHKHVLSDPILSAVAQKKEAMNSRWSQRALQSLQMFHQLKDEASIRYAQALIDREISVLELSDVMDQHELDVAERELQTVDTALAAARQDLKDAEADYARAEADGPAAPRKRDAMDWMNKKAEHSDRLLELMRLVGACEDRIHNEEVFGEAAQKRRTDAVSDLADGRQELTRYLDKRQALDKACHAVLQAQERDKGHELTDAFVDARIKAVWQVVQGVADAIRTLHSRYTPGSNSSETGRHARCTAMAKTLSSEMDDRVRVWWEDLAKLRRRASDMALVDMGRILEHVVMEAIRRNLEAKAAEAREAATLNLLEELEREEQAKKAAQTKKAKKKAGKVKKAEEAAKLAAAAAAIEAQNAKSVEEKVAVKRKEEANLEHQRELEYEAALEKRRQELLKEKEKQEMELRKIARNISLDDGETSTKPASARSAGKGGKQDKEDNTGFQTMKAKASRRQGHDEAPVAPPPPPPPPPPPAKTGHAHLTINTDGREIDMRIITYYGDWNCYCGKINRLWDTCACGQIPPCRDWVRGRCTYGERCRFGHPPFELPDSLTRPKSPIAKPGADAIIYKTARNPEVSAAATAKHTGHHGHGGGAHSSATASHSTSYQKDHHASVASRTTPTQAANQAPANVASVASVSGTAGIAGLTAAAAAAGGQAPPPLKPAPWAAQGGSSGPEVGVSDVDISGYGGPSATLGAPLSASSLMSQAHPVSPTGPLGPPMSPNSGLGLMHHPNPVPMSPTPGMGLGSHSVDTSTRFGLFDGTNSLMGSLGALDGGMGSTVSNSAMTGMSNMSNSVDESIVDRAFAGLDLGESSGAHHHSQGGQQQGFFDQSSFLGMSGSMQSGSSQTQMPYQNDAYSAPFQSMQQSPIMGSQHVASHGYGQHQQSPTMMTSMGTRDAQPGYGVGMQSLDMPPMQQPQTNHQQSDDWNDLQLQLPSDLGEILGSDIFSSSSDQNSQQQQQNRMFSDWGNQQQY